MTDPSAPYVLVAMQECERMNRLLNEIRRSLIELRKGLDGQLNMSEPMEDLQQALSINQVPGRNVFHKTSWEKLAWPSKKSLQSWFLDLLVRVQQVRLSLFVCQAFGCCELCLNPIVLWLVLRQLTKWSSDLVTPLCLWLPGLFNPMAFVTAIMQVTARSTGLPLDKMSIETHVTTMLRPDVRILISFTLIRDGRVYLTCLRWCFAAPGGHRLPRKRQVRVRLVH